VAIVFQWRLRSTSRSASRSCKSSVFVAMAAGDST
jgi:hypothetical protein